MADINTEEVKSNIFKKYPRLENYLSDVEIRDKRSPSWIEGDGQLEFYPKGEEYSPDPSKTIIEVYNPNLKGESLERAVFGDLLHGLPNKDQEFTNLREKFRGSFTQPQMSMALKMYLRDRDKGPSRGFNKAFEVSILDAFIRGGLAPDEKDEWKEHLTKEQKTIVKDMENLLKQPIKKQTGGSINVNEIYDEPLVPLAGMTQEETRQTMEEQRQRATDQQTKEDQIKEQYPILGRIPGVRDMYRDPEKMPQMMSGYFTPFLGNIMDLEEIPYIFKKGKEAFQEGKYGTAALRAAEYGLAGLGGMLLPISSTGIDEHVRSGKNAIRNVINKLETTPRKRDKYVGGFSESTMESVLKNLHKNEKAQRLVKKNKGLSIDELIPILKEQGVRNQEIEMAGFFELQKLGDTTRYQPGEFVYLHQESAPKIGRISTATKEPIHSLSETGDTFADLNTIEKNDPDGILDIELKKIEDQSKILTDESAADLLDPSILEKLKTNVSKIIIDLDKGVYGKQPNIEQLKFNLKKIRGDEGHAEGVGRGPISPEADVRDLKKHGLREPNLSDQSRAVALEGGGQSHVTHSYVFTHPRLEIDPKLKGDHTSVNNEIAFARTTNRVDAQGNKVHHIEEIQSDTLQKKSYKRGVKEDTELLIAPETKGSQFTADVKIARASFDKAKKELDAKWLAKKDEHPLLRFINVQEDSNLELLRHQAYFETLGKEKFQQRLQRLLSKGLISDDAADALMSNFRDDKSIDRLLKENLNRRLRDVPNLKDEVRPGLTKFDREYIDSYKKDIIPLEMQMGRERTRQKIPLEDDVRDWVSHVIQDQIKIAINNNADFVTFTPSGMMAVMENMADKGYKFYSEIVPSAVEKALKKLTQEARLKGFTEWQPPKYVREGNPIMTLDVVSAAHGEDYVSIGRNIKHVDKELKEVRLGTHSSVKWDRLKDAGDEKFFDNNIINLYNTSATTRGLEDSSNLFKNRARINGVAFIDLRDYSKGNKSGYSGLLYDNSTLQNKNYQRNILQNIPIREYQGGGVVDINHLTRSIWQ